jgi:dihydroorotase
VVFDLILKGGRIVDPSQRLDAITDIGFAAGRVARIGPRLVAAPGTDVRDVAGYIVAPGLIDLHTHV